MIAPATEPTYTVDDLDSDLNHLYHLLDVIVDGQQALDHHSPDLHELHRLDALTWIARDLMQAVANKVGDGRLTLREQAGR